MAKKFLTGLNLVVLDVDPATGSEGELYFNSSASVAKIYQAGSWSVLGAGGGGTTVSTTEPDSPEIGDSWYKNDTGEFYIYDGTYWVEVNGVIENPPLTQEEVQDYIAPLFVEGSHTNVVATYDDENNVINLNTSGSLVSIDSIVYPDYITFDTTPEIEPADPGSLWWSTDFETLNLQLDAGVDLQIGQEHLVRVKNSSGLVAIPKGTAVMFAGAAGDTVEATPAVSTADSEPELLIGITAEIIPADGFGFVTQFGFINGTDTETPGWSLGNFLYVDSENPGQLTNVKPSPPNWTFPIAAVTRINSNSGRILVRAIPGKHLHDLVDADISSLLNDQALVYNSSASVWNNANIVNSVNGTDNQILVDNSGIGDVTFSLSDDLITPGNLTVTGDLTVSGSTTYLNTQTLNIEDNIITLNSNVTGSPTGTSGIEVERGDEVNSYILWDESTQTWTFSDDIKTYAIRSDNVFQLDVSASVGSSGEIDLVTDFAELNINTDGSIDLRPGDVSGFETYKFTKTNLQFPDLSQQDTAFLGMPNYDTDDLDEGSSNLYFTNERAIDALNSTLTDYLTLSNASSTYLSQEDASSIYLTQSNASSTYLTTETDPVFVASDAYQITSASTAAWNESYSWGDHSTAGYSLTSHNHSLDSLSNVEISGLVDGESIIWNSASSKWVNELISGGGGGGATTTVSETAPSSPSMGDSWYRPSDGSFFIYDGSYWVEVTSIITMSDEEAQDKVAPLFNHSNHTNITAFYDDPNNEILLSLSENVFIDNDLEVGGYLTLLNSPSANYHAATKLYVDEIAKGIVTKPSVYAATTASLDATYSNGTSGVGATLTSNINGSFPLIDGVQLSTTNGLRGLLVKNQSSSLENGRYNLTTLGDESTPWVLTRCGLCDESDEIPGMYAFVSSGSVNGGKGFIAIVENPETFTIGIDSILYTQFSDTGQVEAGTNLEKDGQTLNVIDSPVFSGTVSASSVILSTPLSHQYGGTGLTSLGSAGYVLAVNATVDGLEWVEMTGGGGGSGLSTTTTSIVLNTATVIESFAIATSRTAEAIIQITQGTDYYSSKVLLIHDGTNVKITEYAILESTVGAIPLTISAAITGSDLEILATITDAATTNATAKVVLIEVAV
jgi:hypothetical protein